MSSPSPSSQQRRSLSSSEMLVALLLLMLAARNPATGASRHDLVWHSRFNNGNEVNNNKNKNDSPKSYRSGVANSPSSSSSSTTFSFGRGLEAEEQQDVYGGSADCQCPPPTEQTSYTATSTTLEAPPVEVVQFDNQAVTFAISQTFTDAILCRMTVFYQSPTEGWICKTIENASPGLLGLFTAVCDASGMGHVTVFAHDALFGTDSLLDVGGYASMVTDHCPDLPPASEGSTVEYTYSVPCGVEAGCNCDPEYPCCQSEEIDVIMADEKDGANASTWLFGTLIESAEFGNYMGGSDVEAGTEISKKFTVPADTQGVSIEFTVYELETAEIYVRIQNTYFVIGNFSVDVIEEEFEGYLGDVYIHVIGVTTTITQVTMIVPEGWFKKSLFLVVGFLTNYGVDDFKMSAICGDFGAHSVSPTTVPTSFTVILTPPPTSPGNLVDCKCPPKVSEIFTSTVLTAGAPVEIVSMANDTVTFTLSQVWSSSPVCDLGVYYESPTSGYICKQKSNVAPGKFGLYTSVCVDGFATVNLYVHDEVYGASSFVSPLDERCPGMEAGEYTAAYTFTIPCSGNPSCPECDLVYPCCKDYEDTIITDEPAGTTAASWMHAVTRNSDEWGDFLGGPIDGEAIEISKSFVIPAESKAVSIEFTLFELQSTTLFMRLQDTYFSLGDFDTLFTEVTDEGYLGDVWIHTMGVSSDVSKVELIVPEPWFNNTFFFSVAFFTNYGVGDFKMTSICDDEFVSAPVPQFSYTPSVGPTELPDSPTVLPSEYPSHYPTVLADNR